VQHYAVRCRVSSSRAKRREYTLTLGLELDGALAQHRDDVRALARAERENQLAVNNPHPVVDDAPVPRPRIGLGGAVLRRRDGQINYRPVMDIQRRPEGLAEAGIRPGIDAHAMRHQAQATAAGGVARGRGFDLQRAVVAEPAGGQPHFLADLMAAGFGIPPGRPGAVAQLMAGLHAGYGARPPVIDVPATIAAVEPPRYPEALPGFTHNFDLESLQPIELNDRGDVVKTKKKPGLVCFICRDRLRLSSNYRTDADRVWTLRCGHMLDQKCLVGLSTPLTQPELDSVIPPLVTIPLLDAPDTKHKKRKTSVKPKKESIREYTWRCAAKGCGKAHKSVQMPGMEGWSQVAGYGAYQVYM
jgi:hypothetical protein